MPRLKFLYGMLGIIFTMVTAASGIGLLFSLSIWDIESAMMSGAFFGFFAFLTGLMGRLMEN